MDNQKGQRNPLQRNRMGSGILKIAKRLLHFQKRMSALLGRSSIGTSIS
jgi:hypothetical protein